MEPWRKELYLKHFGIPGMHWGVRRGPPYPIGSSKSSSPKNSMGNSEDTERKVNRLIRNVAVTAIIASAAVGAAYYAKKHDLFSKIPVSSLKKHTGATVGKIKFSSLRVDLDEHTGNAVFSPLSWQAAANQYADRLKNIDKFVYPDGTKSLADYNIEYNEHGNAIIKAIDDRMRQGVLTSDIVEFARAVSGGRVDPDIGRTTRSQIVMIGNNREIFQRAIDAGEDFGDLKVQQAQELLDIFVNLADIYEPPEKKKEKPGGE